MGVDEDRARPAVRRDTVGWEGVVGDEIEHFAGARVEKAASAWWLGKIDADSATRIGDPLERNFNSKVVHACNKRACFRPSIYSLLTITRASFRCVYPAVHEMTLPGRLEVSLGHVYEQLTAVVLDLVSLFHTHS